MTLKSFMKQYHLQKKPLYTLKKGIGVAIIKDDLELNKGQHQ